MTAMLLLFIKLLQPLAIADGLENLQVSRSKQSYAGKELLTTSRLALLNNRLNRYHSHLFAGCSHAEARYSTACLSAH
jgi:hypothetical protein